MGALTAAAIAIAPGTASAALPASGQCDRPAPFDPAGFTNPTTIDHPMFPLTPGTRFVLQGEANRGGGLLPHTVTFTVTDLTKVVGGVRSVVVWDVDENAGERAETELAFFAQDDAGNVWNLGEYPEEWPGGTFFGAPSTWVAGVNGAEPGIHMLADPQISKTYYLQGYEPAIAEFEDCARVIETGGTVTVPAGTYNGVLTTEEFSPLDLLGGFQLKRHAPGTGIVKVEPVDDPEGETLVLVERRQLSPAELADARQNALALDARGYIFHDAYKQTPRAEGPPEPPPPPPPPAEPRTEQPPVILDEGPPVTLPALTAKRARDRVRRALSRRLGKKWKVKSLTCRLERDGRARCTFTASRRGAKLRGGGSVRRPNDGALRYRLTVRITKSGCRPGKRTTCSRRLSWTS